MTVYIAGKMTGIPNFNRERFNAKENELLEMGFQVLNPAKICDLPSYEMYWPINMAMLDGADFIYMLDGWEDSPGARRELFYAVETGTAVLFENTSALNRLMGFKNHSEAISQLPDCNTCAVQKRCPHAPQLGQWVRINCHLWEAGL